MEFRGTTIVAVKKDGVCAIAGDGQVTSGQQTIMKATARKVKRIYNDEVIIGFAGSRYGSVSQAAVLISALASQAEAGYNPRIIAC